MRTPFPTACKCDAGVLSKAKIALVYIFATLDFAQRSVHANKVSKDTDKNMNILVLGSRRDFFMIEKDSTNNYVLLEGSSLDSVRGRTFQKLILLDKFEDYYENLKDVYRVAFPTIRGEGADLTLPNQLGKIERDVMEYRKKLLRELSA